MSLKFYSLAGKTIKVKLAASNDSTPNYTPEYSGSSPNTMDLVMDLDDDYVYDRNGNRLWQIPTTTQIPITYVAKTHKHDIGYEISK